MRLEIAADRRMPRVGLRLLWAIRLSLQSSLDQELGIAIDAAAEAMKLVAILSVNLRRNRPDLVVASLRIAGRAGSRPLMNSIAWRVVCCPICVAKIAILLGRPLDYGFTQTYRIMLRIPIILLIHEKYFLTMRIPMCYGDPAGCSSGSH